VKKYLKYFLVISLLVFGLFLRIYKLQERTLFDADQEWLATRADKIVKGDFALLGQVTSVGNFSIGPGYIYLVSFTSLLMDNNPISGAVLSVILGVITLFLIYLFADRFIDNKTSIILLLLTVTSFNLITWDQTPWAPSLFFIAQIILLTGAYLSQKNQIGYLVMSLGFILGFQSHFGIVLSLFSILTYFIFANPVRPKMLTIVYTSLIVIIGLSSNIVFDVAHNFSNFNKLAGIFKGDSLDYFLGFGKIINILSNNIVPTLYPRNVNILDNIIVKGIFALILVNCISFLRDKNKNKLSLLLLITTAFPSLFFFIQQGKFSEYYLLMTVPSLLFMLAFFLKTLSKQKAIFIFVLIVATYLNLKAWYGYKKSWSLKSKTDIAEFIVDKVGYENYGISLSTKLGDGFGFKYIFDYYGIKADVPPKKGETKIFSIIIPDGFDGMKGLKTFDGIGLIWQGFD